MKGFIYCISNPQMPGICKCGGTTRDPNIRCKELFTTSLPVECKLEYFIEVNDWKKAENETYKKIIDLGIKRFNKREWFNCDPIYIKSIFDTFFDTNIDQQIIKPILYKKIKPILCKKINHSSYYTCDDCNFNSKNKTDYNRHISSVKHKKNTAKIYNCDSCDKFFSVRSTYYKHRKACSEQNDKIKSNFNNQIMKLKMGHFEEKMEYYEEKIKFLEELVKNSNQTKNKAVEIMSDTISALNVITPIKKYNIMDYNLNDEEEIN